MSIFVETSSVGSATQRPYLKVAFTQLYEGPSINKLQNGAVSLLFLKKISKILNIRYVGNLLI